MMYEETKKQQCDCGHYDVLGGYDRNGKTTCLKCGIAYDSWHFYSTGKHQTSIVHPEMAKYFSDELSNKQIEIFMQLGSL